MSVPVGTDAIAWMLLLSVGGLVVLAIAAVVLRAWEIHAGPETIPPHERRPEPRLYAGCLTCEAARCVSIASLIRHQERDHTGGVAW